MPVGILKKFATDSNGISGVVAFALAGAPPPWAKAAPAPASHATTMNVIHRRIMSSLAFSSRYRLAGSPGNAKTTIVGEPGFLSVQKFEGLPDATAMYCRPPVE